MSIPFNPKEESSFKVPLFLTLYCPFGLMKPRLSLLLWGSSLQNGLSSRSKSLLFVRLERPFCKELPHSSKDKRGFIKPKGQYRVRKRGTLKEDSSLGLKGIDILYINLN